MAFFEDFTAVLKKQWLQYYQENKHWLVLHMKVAAVKTPDGGMRPPAYLILGVMSALEPKLAQLMLPFSQLNPDAERLIDVLGLNFNPEGSGAIAPSDETGDRASEMPVAEPTPEPIPESIPEPTIETPIAVQEVLEQSAPIAETQEESKPNLAGAAAAATAVGVAAAVLGAEAFDDESETAEAAGDRDRLSDDVWAGDSESGDRPSAADELEELSESEDDDVDLGLDALDDSDDDDLGGMDLGGMDDDSDDEDDDGVGDLGLDALDDSDDDDLGGMDLGGLGDDSDDDALGSMDLGGLGDDSDDDDLGGLDLAGLDDDSDDDGLDGLDLAGLNDDSDDDGLDGLDLDDLGGDDGLDGLDLDDLGGDDDDTSDLLKGL